MYNYTIQRLYKKCWSSPDSFDSSYRIQLTLSFFFPLSCFTAVFRTVLPYNLVRLIIMKCYTYISCWWRWQEKNFKKPAVLVHDLECVWNYVIICIVIACFGSLVLIFTGILVTSYFPVSLMSGLWWFGWYVVSEL